MNLTVKELISELEKLEQDLKIFYRCPEQDEEILCGIEIDLNGHRHIADSSHLTKYYTISNNKYILSHTKQF